MAHKGHKKESLGLESLNFLGRSADGDDRPNDREIEYAEPVRITDYRWGRTKMVSNIFLIASVAVLSIIGLTVVFDLVGASVMNEELGGIYLVIGGLCNIVLSLVGWLRCSRICAAAIFLWNGWLTVRSLIIRWPLDVEDLLATSGYAILFVAAVIFLVCTIRLRIKWREYQGAKA